MGHFRVSGWSFDTSASVSIGIGAAAASGGMIALRDPDNKVHHLHYGGLGSGFSIGASLTEISVPDTLVRNYDLSGTGSSTSFFSVGKVFITETFKARELSLGDIQGVALYIEAGGALISAAGFTVMFLGIDPIFLEAAVIAPMFSARMIELALGQAPAVLIMGGLAMGPQVGAGFSGLIGLLH
ncbi:hypothetical protein PQQ51_25455 [Paraburkholderia xenovorans]|uniref:hypothetical protein n=1 Tax=Paraburkholderia xenovorans TaxID=36873 RepID=UPI0038BC7422